MNEEKKLVPKLRFPEFRDALDWKDTRLGQLGELVSGLTYSPDDVRETGLLVLRSSNVQNGKIALDDCVYVDPATKGANLSQANDILICVRNGSVALIGKNALIPESMPLCTHGAFMTVFRSKSAKFAFQLFQSEKYQKQVDGDLGATINSINGGQFVKYTFAVPQPAEQQKIADCLSSLDELIAALARKVDALKTHKKGLMQQLFPREGETQPRLRFPEFRDAEEWEVNKLGRICKSIASGKDKNDLEGTFDLYGSTGVIGKTSEATFDGTYILVARVGANAGFLNKVTGKFGVTDNTLIVDLHTTDQLDFVYCCLDKIGLNKFVFGSGQPLITGTQLKELRVSFPFYKEQQRIADCLTSLDDLITAATQELETLKTHKKALMQQLFPSAEAVEK